MKTITFQKAPSRVFEQRTKRNNNYIISDNRPLMLSQAKMTHNISNLFPIQRVLSIHGWTVPIKSIDDIPDAAKALYDDDWEYSEKDVQVNEIEAILKELIESGQDCTVHDFDIKDKVLEKHKKEASLTSTAVSAAASVTVPTVAPTVAPTIPNINKMHRAHDSDISILHIKKQQGIAKWKNYITKHNPDLCTSDDVNFYVRLDKNIDLAKANSIFQKDHNLIVTSGGAYYGLVCSF